MTSSAPGTHPSPEEVDALLDPSVDDAPDDVGRSSVATHVAGCRACQEVSASLHEVRDLLREEAGRTPPPPADLGRRLDVALARASAERRGTVVPLRSEASGRRGPRSVPAWVSVAAVLTVLGGSAVAATQLMGDSSTPMAASGGGGAAEQAPEAGDGTSTVATGTDYRRDELASQVAALVGVAGTVPLQAAPRTGGDEAAGDEPGADEPGAPEAATEDLGLEPVLPGAAAADADEPLAGPGGLQGCLEAIGADGAVPLAVDLARFEGEEAAVLVLPGDDPGQAQVWVVSRDCRPGADGLREYRVVPLP